MRLVVSWPAHIFWSYGFLALIALFVFIYYFLHRKDFIVSSLVEVEVGSSYLRVGNKVIHFNKGVTILQTSGKVWLSGAKNVYFVKILSNWTKGLAPMLVGAALGSVKGTLGAAGSGMILGSNQTRVQSKSSNLTLVLDKEQLVEFLGAISQVEAEVKVKDFTKGLYPWITRQIVVVETLADQNKFKKAKIKIQIFVQSFWF